MSLLLIHAHGFDLPLYVKHLFFDGIADAGGYYASRLCDHRWHRVLLAVSFALVTTLALVTLIG